MRTTSMLLVSAAACLATACVSGCEPAASEPATSTAPVTSTEPATAKDDDVKIEVVEGNTFERGGVSIAIELRALTAKQDGRDWFDVVLTCGGPDGLKASGAMERTGTLDDWHSLVIGQGVVIGDIESTKIGDGNVRVRAHFSRPNGGTTHLAFVNFR